MTFQLIAEQVRARPHQIVELATAVPVHELATPALTVDRAALLRNIRKMSDHVQHFGKGFRPHAKTHKCPVISQLQLDAGAEGVCVAKTSEAIALVAAGIKKILITSPLTVAPKLDLVLDLVNRCEGGLSLVVDSQLGLDLLIQRTDVIEVLYPLNVVIDLDVEMGRTGVRSNDLVSRLYETIQNCSKLHFLGFQHYAGHVMHIQGHAARSERSLALWEKINTRLSDLQIEYEILTGCGTGTYDIDVEVPTITDIQVGSYIFMDEEYRQIGSVEGERFNDFEVSLHLASTAISQPMQGTITLDAGYKSLASDTVPAAVDELANTKFRFAGDEHSVLLSKESMQSLQLGNVVKLITPHCDPTVNLHDYYWVVEDDGLVHNAWPITGRGCTW